MATMLHLGDNGAGSETMVGVMNDMLGGALPTNVPSRTGMNIGNINGLEPTDAMTTAIMNNIGTQSNGGNVPFQAELASDLAPFFTGMAFQDTSFLTTDEGINDQVMESPIMAAPWDDGAEQTIQQYDPLFVYNTMLKDTSPGFHVVATPPIINQIQARLQQKEQQAALYGVTTIVTARNNRPALLGTGGSSNDPSEKRRRLYDVGLRGTTAPKPTTPQLVDSNQLDTLRFYGSLTPEGLYEKLNYLGPVTQIADSNGSGPVIREFGRADVINERLLNYSYHSRGHIANIFAPELEAGDSLFFTIGKYSKSALIQLGSTNGGTRYALGKRGVDQMSAYSSSTVGMPSRATSGDELTQIRGWSSRNGNEYLGITSPVDSMKPDVADRYYVDRMRRAAVEYREYEYDDATGRMREIPTLADEGLQEAVANLPDLIIENYLAPGIIIPVGVVKQRLNKRTTAVAIMNAHYDQRLLAAQPHVEIVQNRF